MQNIILIYDAPLDIATGKHRRETAWRNRSVPWSELVTKLSVTHRTAETYAAYLAAAKDRQAEIKDIGGFVAGYINNGRRKLANVMHRSCISLDIDHGKPGAWDEFKKLFPVAACMHTTHKHSTEAPRIRIIIPLDRPVFVDEYEPIARYIAGKLNIEYFLDVSTFRADMLVYWPSTSKDGVFESDYVDDAFLCADDILATYHNWKDASEWPRSETEDLETRAKMAKAGDPLEKPGLIGAFCRAYTLTEVLGDLLAGVYEPTDQDGRYTFIDGSTAGGLVVYEDKYAYSHHGTDPAGGLLCNAFDLVRLHKFGNQDDDSKADTPINRKPSFMAMQDFAGSDKLVRRQLAAERLESAQADFASVEINSEAVEDTAAAVEWMETLEADKKGNYLASRANFRTILLNDSKLKDCFGYDVFSKRKILTKGVPWRKVTDDNRLLADEDESDLRIYLSCPPYELSHNGNLKDVLDSVTRKNEIHPVKDYLGKLKWDGIERLDTLFIDYMGASDTLYTRTVTRKAFTAAVARVHEPGIKFDHILTLIGEEGKQKSSIFQKLGGEWFSDTFSFEMLKRGKEAFEQLQGYWLIEVPELTGMRKGDIEAIKHFVSKRDDIYRVPHAEYTSKFKRQCVFFGTTNEWDFLQSNNGNRRFWPVPILLQDPIKSVSKDLTVEEIGQLWAEALFCYGQNETLYLTPELENSAKMVQRGHTIEHPWAGIIQQYIERKLPEDWAKKDMYERREFLAGGEMVPAGTVERDRVCVAEIWCEAIKMPLEKIDQRAESVIRSIMQNADGWQENKEHMRFHMYGKMRRGYVKTGVPEPVKNLGQGLNVGTKVV